MSAAQTPAPSPSGTDWRARIRNSRLGTFLVLALTTSLVLVGAWFVQQPGEGGGEGEGTGIGSAQAVELTASSNAPPPEVGAPATDFTARTTTGETLTLSDLKGRPVWLTFGASWCSACRVEMPDIQAAYEANKSDGLEVVGVYLSETDGEVTSFNERLGLTFPAVSDPDTKVASSYKVMGIPAHFFIDARGNISSMHVGVLDEKTIEESLAAIR